MHSHAKVEGYSLLAGRPPYAACDFYRNGWLRFRSFVNSKATQLAVIISAVFIQLIVSIGAQAGGRVALVLACENYDHFKTSAVSAKWAREFGQALKEQNFDVTVAANRNDAQTRASLREFSLKAEQADFALIVVSGHIVTYQNQSFFLPQNARVQRATDLFSRALSLASIADIGGKAKSAGLLLLMTVPDISSTIADINARPATNGLPTANVVTVFSSSPRVPVSGVDRVSEQAAEKLLDAARETPLTLNALVKAASAEGIGQVFGEISPMNLSAPLETATASDAGSKAAFLEAAEKAAKAQAEAERTARAASIARDQAEAERKAAEKRMREERERARLAEERARDAEQRAKQAQEVASKSELNTADTRSLQVVEDLLGWEKRKEIQDRLRSLRLYRGRIDAVFGPLTRSAIKEFQKLSGEPETGYLTPNQFKRLVETR